LPVEGVDHQLGHQRLCEPGQPAEEAEQATAEQRPPVGSNMGQQKAPGGRSAGPPARDDVVDLARVDQGDRLVTHGISAQ